MNFPDVKSTLLERLKTPEQRAQFEKEIQRVQKNGKVGMDSTGALREPFDVFERTRVTLSVEFVTDLIRIAERDFQ